MKKFTQKFIGLLVLVNIITGNLFAQAPGEFCTINIGDMIGDVFGTYDCSGNCIYNGADISACVFFQNDINTAYDSGYSDGEASVTPDDGVNQSDVDGAYFIGFGQGVASVEVPQCEEVATQDTPFDLPEGWSMFGYTCLDSVDPMVGFSEITDKIEIVKDEWGLAYIPAWGFSAFDNLEFGEGYQIKMIEGVTDFQFCTTIPAGCSQEELDAAYAYGAASVIPEDGIGQADVDAANAAAAAAAAALQAQLDAVNGAADALQANLDAAEATISTLQSQLDTALANQEDGIGQADIDSAIAQVYEMFEGWCASDLDNDGVCDVDEVIGCLNESACNFNNIATDEGDCIYAEEYLDCDGACINDTDQDGVCNENEIIGCQDSTAFNYNSAATDPDECEAIVYGCMDDEGCNFLSTANLDDNFCEYPDDGYDCDGNEIIRIGDIYQGGYVFEINDDGTGLVADLSDVLFNPNSEIVSNFTESYVSEILTGDHEFHIHSSLNQMIVFDLNSQGYSDWRTPSIEELNLMYNTIGPGASGGYEALNSAIMECVIAGGSSGQCYEEYLNSDALPINIANFASSPYWSSTSGNDLNCDQYSMITHGCHQFVDFGINFSSGYEINENNFEFMRVRAIRSFTRGCMDSTAFNFNPNANADDASCLPVIEGCTEQSAFNYDPNANTDDDSCVDIVYGCMSPDACNFSANANIENNTCEYLVEGYDCDGNIDLHIGDLYDGGIIFHINENGSSGLVVSNSDVEHDLHWQHAFDLYGQINNPEAGWYLPSIEELQLLYNSLGSQLSFIAGVDDSWYWSSTPYMDLPPKAMCIKFSTGQTSPRKISSTYPVRLIRNFNINE